MRLITRIRSINEAFAHVMYQKGHAREFHQGDIKKASRSLVCSDNDSDSDNDGDNDGGTDSSISAKGDEVDRSSLYDELHFEIPKLHEGDLSGILSDPYWCPEPETDSMLHHIQERYLQSRGYEIGTVSFSCFILL